MPGPSPVETHQIHVATLLELFVVCAIVFSVGAVCGVASGLLLATMAIALAYRCGRCALAAFAGALAMAAVRVESEPDLAVLRLLAAGALGFSISMWYALRRRMADNRARQTDLP